MATTDTAPPPVAVDLVGLMARLAAGDGLAVFELLEHYRAQIRAVVRRSLVALRVTADRDAEDELVVEAVLAIQEAAAGWRAEGGAAPWTWAERRIHARVAAHFDRHHDSLEGSALDERVVVEETVTTGHDEPELLTLERLAADHPAMELLVTALREAASPRHQAILLAYEALKADGDPSPANTLAVAVELSPANIRQIVRRTKVRVNRLVQADDRFTAIRALPILR